MKIRLNNIKCYEDETFDFGDSGIALLSGQSGKGKSSIIQGIYFALFGSGSKITSFGKTTCRVELEFDDIKVVRSKNPNKLVVNDSMEDKVAQEFINIKFGNTFDVTGYIPQNAMKSFVLMSATDKLAFLEKFAFSDLDLNSLKDKCKSYITSKHSELIESTARLETMNEVVDGMEEPEYVDFPLSVKNGNYKESIKVAEKNLSIINLKIDVISNRIEELTKEERDILTSKNNQNILEEHISNLNYDLEALKPKQDEVSEYIGDESLQEYVSELETLVKNRDHINRKNKLETDTESMSQILKEETENMKSRLSDIKTNTWTEYSHEEWKDIKDSLDIMYQDAKRISKIQAKITNKGTIEEMKTLRSEIKKCMGSKHSCPSCNKTLCLVDNSLVLTEHENEYDTSDKNTLRRKLEEVEESIRLTGEVNDIIDSYEDEITDIKSLKSDIEYMENYGSEQVHNEKLIKKIQHDLDNGIFSSVCKTLMENVENLRIELLNEEVLSDSVISDAFDEQELRDIIKEQTMLKYKNNTLREQETNMKIKLDKYKSELSELKNRNIGKWSTQEIINIIETNKTELSVLKDKKEDISQKLTKVERWKDMNEQLKKYNSMEEKIIDLQKDETRNQHEYAALLTLKDKILEAESIAVANVINSINTHAKVYLDEFFETDPITVELKAFKNVKNTVKAQINMDIEYKGMECDLCMLSGGEISRVVLAYTLALAEMFNTPLLLLDECTASLDQETADHVFESIRDNFNGKLTLIVAHQVVTGTFDRIISLD